LNTKNLESNITLREIADSYIEDRSKNSFLFIDIEGSELETLAYHEEVDSIKDFAIVVVEFHNLLEVITSKDTRKYDDLIAKNQKYADDEIYVCRMHNTDVHLNCYYKWLTISENLRTRIEKLNDELVPVSRRHTIKDIQDWEIYPNIVVNSDLNNPERILANFYFCVNPECVEKMSTTCEVNLGNQEKTKVYVTKNTEEFKKHLYQYHHCVKISETKMKLFYDSKYFEIIDKGNNFKHSGSVVHPVSHFYFCDDENKMKHVLRLYLRKQ
jgi:hypothetical protein